MPFQTGCFQFVFTIFGKKHLQSIPNVDILVVHALGRGYDCTAEMPAAGSAYRKKTAKTKAAKPQKSARDCNKPQESAGDCSKSQKTARDRKKLKSLQETAKTIKDCKGKYQKE